MLRIVSRLVLPQLRPNPVLLKTPNNICAIYKSKMFFNSAAESVKEVSPISASLTHVLRRCQSFTDLFYHFDKRDRFLTFNHLAVMVKKFHEFHQNRPTNVMLETNYNQIISKIVHYCEQESDEISAGDIASIYFCISQIPYSNQFTKRCNFVIEQKGVALFKEMNPFETSIFFSTLVKNKKRGFAQSMLPYIEMHIHDYKLGLLTKTLDSIATLDAKVPEIAARVKDILLQYSKIEKLRAREYSYVVRFFSQYTDIEGANELFRRLELRFKWIERECDAETINTLISSILNSEKLFMSLSFYDDLSEKIKNMEDEIDREYVIPLLKFYTKNGLEYLLARNDFILKFVPECNTMDAQSLVVLLYYLSKSRSMHIQEAEAIIQNLFSQGPFDLDHTSVENLLVGYSHFLNRRNPNSFLEEQKMLTDVVLQKIDGFSIDKFLSIIIKNFNMFDPKDQKLIFDSYQDKVLRHELTRVSDIKNIHYMAYLLLTKYPDMTNKDFVNQMIDFSLNFMTEKVNQETSVLHPRFLETFGNFLSGLLNVELDATYAGKRIELLNVTEEFLVKIYKTKGSVPEELLSEKNLLLFIKSFHTVFGQPSQELEKIFTEALNTLGLNSLNSANIEYLSEKTSLARDSISVAQL